MLIICLQIDDGEVQPSGMFVTSGVHCLPQHEVVRDYTRCSQTCLLDHLYEETTPADPQK